MFTEVLDFIRSHVLTLSALTRFAIILGMLVTIPRLCRRVHVPPAVGLLLAGVIVGPYGLGFFSTDRPIADFLAELGQLLLMFFAGLEIDLALFRIRPAPFCLLDEVDAPLDDANVERLAGLLREMSGGTQFLLITHNRRTMAHADVLYGVTMEESCVSRIVSVRLEE